VSERKKERSGPKTDLSGAERRAGFKNQVERERSNSILDVLETIYLIYWKTI